jgi:hypothetical protein
VTARFGVSDLFVRQRMKPANVAPRFVERGANASAQDRDGSDSTSPEEDGIAFSSLTLSETEIGGLGGNGWPNERARDGRYPEPDPKTVREQRMPDAG